MNSEFTLPSDSMDEQAQNQLLGLVAFWMTAGVFVIFTGFATFHLGSFGF